MHSRTYGAPRPAEYEKLRVRTAHRGRYCMVKCLFKYLSSCAGNSNSCSKRTYREAKPVASNRRTVVQQLGLRRWHCCSRRSVKRVAETAANGRPWDPVAPRQDAIGACCWWRQSGPGIWQVIPAGRSTICTGGRTSRSALTHDPKTWSNDAKEGSVNFRLSNPFALKMRSMCGIQDNCGRFNWVFPSANLFSCVSFIYLFNRSLIHSVTHPSIHPSIHYLTNGMIFGRKELLNIKCVFWFSL